MSSEAQSVLEQVTTKTQSELILFFIILAVVLMVLIVPLYTLILKDRKEKNKQESDRLGQYMEREKRIIEVVTANTEVMASLKTTLDRDGKATTASIERVHDRLDKLVETDTTLMGAIIKSQASQDEATRHHDIIKSDLKALLIAFSKVSGIMVKSDGTEDK